MTKDIDCGVFLVHGPSPLGSGVRPCGFVNKKPGIGGTTWRATPQADPVFVPRLQRLGASGLPGRGGGPLNVNGWTLLLAQPQSSAVSRMDGQLTCVPGAASPDCENLFLQHPDDSARTEA